MLSHNTLTYRNSIFFVLCLHCKWPPIFSERCSPSFFFLEPHSVCCSNVELGHAVGPPMRPASPNCKDSTDHPSQIMQMVTQMTVSGETRIARMQCCTMDHGPWQYWVRTAIDKTLALPKRGRKGRELIVGRFSSNRRTSLFNIRSKIAEQLMYHENLWSLSTAGSLMQLRRSALISAWELLNESTGLDWCIALTLVPKGLIFIDEGRRPSRQVSLAFIGFIAKDRFLSAHSHVDRVGNTV